MQTCIKILILIWKWGSQVRFNAYFNINLGLSELKKLLNDIDSFGDHTDFETTYMS